MSAGDCDQRTIFIVSGFIRRIKSKYRKFKYLKIPSYITKICLFYISDHFMLNRGSYCWYITDRKYLKQLLYAKTGSKFCSPSFTVGKLKWCMDIFPNGTDISSTGSVCIAIKLLSKLPYKWKSIDVCSTIYCAKSQSRDTYTSTYTKLKSSFAWPGLYIFLILQICVISHIFLFNIKHN